MRFLNQRINRATYWLCVALLALGSAVMTLLVKARPPVNEVILVMLFIPRLHDLGRSGWWSLVPIGLEIGLVTALAAVDMFGLGTWLATLAVSLCVVVLGALKGQPTANRFGEPPGPGIVSALRGPA